MKIGILLRELHVYGGTQRLVLSLAMELAKTGDDVTVFALQVDRNRCYPGLAKDLRVVDLAPLLPAPTAVGKGTLALRRLLGTSPDLVLNHRIADLLPADLDILNAHEHFVYPAAVYWKRRTGKPIFWTMNDLPGEYISGWDPGKPWKRLDRVLNGKERENGIKRKMAVEFDEILMLPGPEGPRLFRRTGIRGKVIPGGLDAGEFPFLPRKAPGSRNLRLLSSAILYPHRRLEDIVEALRILSGRGIGFEWTHVGDVSRVPRYHEEILRGIASAGLAEAVAFAGAVDDGELVRQYRQADVFLFPNTPQSWGLAPFEAMACGTPVVVSRGAGASEVLTHGKNALLVDPYSPAQIADALVELSRDGALWEALHVEGRRFVEENIRWDRYAGEVRESFLSTKGRGR